MHALSRSCPVRMIVVQGKIMQVFSFTPLPCRYQLRALVQGKVDAKGTHLPCCETPDAASGRCRLYIHMHGAVSGAAHQWMWYKSR